MQNQVAEHEAELKVWSAATEGRVTAAEACTNALVDGCRNVVAQMVEALEQHGTQATTSAAHFVDEVEQGCQQHVVSAHHFAVALVRSSPPCRLQAAHHFAVGPDASFPSLQAVSNTPPPCLCVALVSVSHCHLTFALLPVL